MVLNRVLSSLVAIALIIGAPTAYAVQPDEIMANPVQESRARELSRELRCMVCQNQSIDDSDAPLARDLRLLVRERIASGDSNSQVIEFSMAAASLKIRRRKRSRWRPHAPGNALPGCQPLTIHDRLD